MVVAIQGMGWFGSLLASVFADHGIEFVWADTDAEHVAWKASTGCCYPTGDDRSMRALDVWLDDWSKRTPLADFTAQVPFLTTHKTPPPGGFAHDFGPLRRTNVDAVMVDVPEFVAATRERFADRRVPVDDLSGDLVVEAHAPSRRTGYSWGWTVAARFDHGFDRGFTVYGRPHRFAIRYAHWQPVRGVHLCGSTLLRQKHPATRNVAPDLDRWLADIEAWAPLITLRSLGEIRQGWRPIGDGDEHVRRDGDRILLPAIPYSGVRHAPHIVAEVLREVRA